MKMKMKMRQWSSKSSDFLLFHFKHKRSLETTSHFIKEGVVYIWVWSEVGAVFSTLFYTHT